jgi:rhodanese-related sulfurtransferase
MIKNKIVIIWMAVILMFFALSVTAYAEEAFSIISTIDLKAKIDSGTNLLLLNPLSDIEFADSHLPNSVNIPLHTIKNSDKLPKDKNTLVVTYCLGPAWVLSKKAASLVADLGYTNVMVFVDGIPGWVKEGYPIQSSDAVPKVEIPSLNITQLKDTLANVRVLDIRNEDLFNRGYIKDSIKIPMEFLSARLNDIPKDKKLVVVDHAGKQSLMASRFLKSKGYDVDRLLGGMNAWLKEGQPVEK